MRHKKTVHVKWDTAIGHTLALLAIITSVHLFPPELAFAQGQMLTNTIVHAGYNRTYVVYVPSGYTPGHRTPLVLNLHGSGNTAADQIAKSGMNVVAEESGFLVVYPQAVGGSWWGPSGNDPYDDGGYIASVISRVCFTYSVNASRVYGTGFSAGGGIVYGLSALWPYTFAAIAPVAVVRPYAAGTTTIWPTNIPPLPSRPLPLLHVHGTGDQVDPYAGGYSSFTGSTYPSVEQWVGDWALNNGCGRTPTVTSLADVDPTDGTTVQLLTYTNCGAYQDSAGNLRPAEVLLYRVVNAGHTWPGDYRGWTQWWSLPANHDINASRQMWNFFSRHEVAAAPGGRFEDLSCSPVTGFRFTFRDGGTGARYRIQASASLLPGSWLDLTNFLYTGTVTITDPASNGTTRRFYRAVSP